MFDLSIFTTYEAWISLITLTFLEVVLGVDNIVFISITTDRLPSEKQHIGRKLGLAGAMVMRILFLCVASYFVHLVAPLFTIDLGFWHHDVSIRDIVLFAGGVYLIYKGVTELHSTISIESVKEEERTGRPAGKRIGLLQAVATIMVMDIVFSIDSVITAVGLADHLIIMIIAVIFAVLVMMVFIDPISNFINRNPEMKILALAFITLIGVLLVSESLGFSTGIEVLGIHLEKFIAYLAMLFAFITVLLRLKHKENLRKFNEHSEGFED